MLGGRVRLGSGEHAWAAFPHTNTRNRAGGRGRDGWAVSTWEPPVAPPPRPSTTPAARMTAFAFGTVTMNGTQPTYQSTAVSSPASRQRIIIGGRDVTFFRGVPTPPAEYDLLEPLMFGPANVEFPQIAAAFEEPGVGRLKWLAKGKPVVIQRVVGEVVTGTVYRGFVVAFDVSGPTLRVEIGGQAQGRAALREVPTPIFRARRDLGRIAYHAIDLLNLPFEPRLGPETGLKSAVFGGMDHLSYLEEICARAWSRTGTGWTIMPGAKGIYRMRRKDVETIDFTVYADDRRAVANLRSDMAEEPNRIYATGVTPRGQRVRFGSYPGLKQSAAAPYPYRDGRDFGRGTTDADTRTGDGVTVMIHRLGALGYLSMDELPGGYDADAEQAVEDLQADADLPETGTMTTATWAALFDLSVTGYTLAWSRILPAAQRSYTRKFLRSPSGAVMGRNPRYRRHRIVVDRSVDMGAGMARKQIRGWARAELDRGEGNWVGSITLHTGAVLRGAVAPGAAVAAADVMDARLLKPGMNAWLPHFSGGIVVHVSGVSVDSDTVTLAVDTRARDAMEIWQIIERNREARASAVRRFRGNRQSTRVPDAIDVWDEVGGVLDGDVHLARGWNVIPVVAGQEGTVSRIRLRLAHRREFACAAFGANIRPQRLAGLVGNPLTEAGTEAWEKRAVRRALESRGLLYSAGTKDEPCGYSPGRKSKSASPTGVHSDDAGFAYRCGPHPVLYLAVWVASPTRLLGGRVMWNQLEAGA